MDHPNEKYLIDEGYEFCPHTEHYIYRFIDGRYRAGNAVHFTVVTDAPIDYLKAWHERFIKLAKQHYDFSEGVN
jgi:hypothetical protein